MQHIVVNRVFADLALDQQCLHFAPEAFFRSSFKSRFSRVITADLTGRDVDQQIDITDIPFGDGAFDVVFASHVLEHVEHDIGAINEIHRVLSPRGVAILPVPIVATKTIEYPEANPREDYHVRAPGPDYFDRYRNRFSRVDVYSSDSFPSEHQLHLFEDRTSWPNESCPLRRPMSGTRHLDYVPVCFKQTE